MISVDLAYRKVLSLAHAGLAREVPLLEALGLVLAEPIVARQPLPPLANSAMDGYAVRLADTAGATPEAPVRLRVTGDALPGMPPGVLEPGCAHRIMTGGAVPAGADAIVPVEDTGGFGEVAEVQVAPEPGAFVRPAGEDVMAGQLAMAAGEVLNAPRIGMLAALGHASVRVVPPVRVGILASGNEIVPPGQPLLPGQIHDSNAYALHAAVCEVGAVPLMLGIAPDDRPRTRDLLESALDRVEVLLTTGGVSMGQHDHVGPLLRDLGTVHFDRVAQQPGKPLTVATVAGKTVFALPGNPVSALVCFELYVRPFLLKAMGHIALDRPRRQVRLAEPVRGLPDKRRFLRAVLDDGEARLTGPQGSGLIHSMVAANGLVVIPEGAPELDEAEALYWHDRREASMPVGSGVAPEGLEESRQAGISQPGGDRSLTHLDEAGNARMVDVTAKAPSVRVAVAEGVVAMTQETANLLADGALAKGDVLAVARVAGIQAAKRTAELIPLCHPVPLTGLEIAFELDAAAGRLRIEATARTTAPTGVEMEALTAVSVAALAIYDMVKAVERGVELGPIRLLRKEGGKSGTWTRP